VHGKIAFHTQPTLTKRLAALEVVISSDTLAVHIKLHPKKARKDHFVLLIVSLHKW